MLCAADERYARNLPAEATRARCSESTVDGRARRRRLGPMRDRSCRRHRSVRRLPGAAWLAKAEIIMPVRPEETGPVISLSAPRGRPPVRASSSAMPMGTVCGAMRSRNNSVGARRSPSDDSMRARSVAVAVMEYLEGENRVSGIAVHVIRYQGSERNSQMALPVGCLH